MLTYLWSHNHGIDVAVAGGVFVVKRKVIAFHSNPMRGIIMES